MGNSSHTFSWQALSRIIFVGIALILAWMARGAFVDILIALVLACSLYPIVERIKHLLHVPRFVSILLVLIILLLPFVILAFTIKPVVLQAPELLAGLLAVLSHTGLVPRSVKNFDITTYIQTHTATVLASGEIALFIALSVTTIIILTFYFIYDSERLIELFLGLFPDGEQDRLKKLLGEIADVTGRYVRGNVLISLICIAVVAIGLFLLHVPYVIPLALFAGIVDLLPLVGSTVGAIPSIMIAFGISPLTGILIIALFVAYQQVESALISPAIYNKALNISPALSFLSVIVGASLFGVLGAFLALPVAASLPVLMRYQKEYSRRKK